LKNEQPPFKACGLCGKVWETKEAFLGDKTIRLNGYQWNVKKIRQGLPAAGLLLFTHYRRRCGTTLAIVASTFRQKNKKTDPHPLGKRVNI